MAAELQILSAPSDFGNYWVERELGRGGMGGVYLAVDRMLDRPVALKVMRKSFGDDPDFAARFQHEAKSAARLNNPHIVQVYAFGQTDGIPYIAMEFVGNGSLQREIKDHPQGMDPVRVMQVGRQIAEALSCAASHGFVHGDVKPENVLYAEDGTAKLADFGLAAMQASARDIWGTPYYISPEKVRSQTLDFRADMYSLGGTLYHALTGQPPFDHADPIELMKLRLHGTPPWPGTVRKGIPAEVDAIVMRLLQTEPAMRYSSFDALLADIDAFFARYEATKKFDPSATAKRPMPVKLVRPATVKMPKPASASEPTKTVPTATSKMPAGKSVVLRHVKKEELYSRMAQSSEDGTKHPNTVRTARHPAPPPRPRKERTTGSGGMHAFATFCFVLLLLLGAGAVWYFYLRPKTVASTPRTPVRTGSGEVKIIKTPH